MILRVWKKNYGGLEDLRSENELKNSSNAPGKGQTRCSPHSVRKAGAASLQCAQNEPELFGAGMAHLRCI